MLVAWLFPIIIAQRNSCMKTGLACRTTARIIITRAFNICSGGRCMTGFYSPSIHTYGYSGPDCMTITTLFTDVIIEHLLRPRETVKNYYVYETLCVVRDPHRHHFSSIPPTHFCVESVNTEISCICASTLSSWRKKTVEPNGKYHYEKLIFIGNLGLFVLGSCQ